jgi:hypothetical protein
MTREADWQVGGSTGLFRMKYEVVVFWVFVALVAWGLFKRLPVVHANSAIEPFERSLRRS